MPKGIVPPTKITPKPKQHISNENIDTPQDISTTNNVQKTATENIPEISDNEFNNLKKKISNNIFGEIEEIISDNNITQENNMVNEKEIDNNIESPELVPVTYNSENIISNIDYSDNEEDNEEDDEEDDEADDINSDDENISDDLDEDKLEIYMKYSVKELKDKCVEMNLKHSGNKSTLAKRIVDNLK